MKDAAPGVVHELSIPRAPGAPARVRDHGADQWEPLGVAPPRGLYAALVQVLGVGYRPVWVDVRIEHGYPMPTGHLLDRAEPLSEHLTLAVLQTLTARLLQDKRTTDNPGLSQNGA